MPLCAAFLIFPGHQKGGGGRERQACVQNVCAGGRRRAFVRAGFTLGLPERFLAASGGSSLQQFWRRTVHVVDAPVSHPNDKADGYFEQAIPGYRPTPL